MKSYKLLSLIRLFVLPLTLSLMVTACIKPSPRSADPNAEFGDPTKPDANQPAATFYNDEVSGSAVVSKTMKGFSIADEKLFSFKTCVKDKRTQESVKGHKFEIIGGQNVTVTKDGRSDESGCVYWTEKIAFNGLSDGKYLQIRRTLAANGMHTGARNLLICINPWESGSETVRDCSRKPVPEDQLVVREEAEQYLKGQSKSGESFDRYFWVDDLRMSSVHDPGATQPGTIDFNVAFTPKVLRKDSRANDDPLPLSNGTFKGQFWIVAKTGGEVYGKTCIVLAKSGQLNDMKMVAGKFKQTMRMKVGYLNTMGQLELAAFVEPQNASLEMKPFNGLWLMGDHTSLLGMKFGFEKELTYKDIGQFDVQKYIGSCIDSTDGMTMDKTQAALTGKYAVDSKETPKDTSLVKVTVPNRAIVEDLGGQEKVLPLNGKNDQLDLTAMIPADLAPKSLSDMVPQAHGALVPTDKCVDSTDIPRLFPQDAVATKLKPGPDFLSCSNDKLPSGMMRVEPFEFAYVSVKPEPVKQETSTERTIVYTVTTKVKNPLAQGAPFRDIEFTVTTGDHSQTVRTNLDGDLIFKDEIHHSYFMPERYMLKVVEIKHASGFTKRLGIVFNPWDNNGFTFFRDLRAMTKQMIASVNLVPRPKSALLLTQFQWGTVGFRYRVDDFLNLKIFKQFIISLSPRVLRYSSLTEGRNKDEPLRAGVYLMKVALQKNYKRVGETGNEYITVISKLVRVRNGVINEPVEIEFRDLKVLKLRSNLLIELATIDETKLTKEELEHLGTVKVPLDSLIAHDSGLAPRTFIGPVVAYSNGFSASMRPADDLAENVCETIDCDEIKRDEIVAARKEKEILLRKEKTPQKQLDLAHFEQSLAEQKAREEKERRDLEEEKKYVGDIKHLANKTVTDLIGRMRALNAKERADLVANSRLSRFLSELNLEYASVYNEAQIMGQDPKIAQNNQTLIKGNGFNDLVFRMNRLNPKDSTSNRPATIAHSLSGTADMPMQQMFIANTRTPLTAERFHEALYNTSPLPIDMAMRLCVVMIEDIVLQTTPQKRKAMGFLEGMAFQERRRTLNDECMRWILKSGNGKDGSEPVIVKERKFRVFKVRPEDDRRPGNLMTVNVNAGSGYGFGQSESVSTSFSPTKALEGIAKHAGLALAEKFLDIAGLSVSMSSSTSHSFGADVGTGAGQNLAIETREMRVWFDEYERCTTIRLSQIFVEHMAGSFLKALPDSLTPAQKMSRMGRGVVVCEGIVQKKVEAFDERYYQISQLIGDEVMNDPTSLENHPYLRDTLRSRGDYQRLMNLIEARPQTVGEIRNLPINLSRSPMERLTRVFATKIPKYPGIITIEPGTLLSDSQAKSARK